MKAGVIVFPGSNCDRDAFLSLKANPACEPVMVWHGDSQLPKLDLVVIPGGFSYGDYLRSGAISAHSPIMREVKKHAEKGGLVLGICNGFQVLTETHLLPGTLMRNRDLKFICDDIWLKVENTDSAFTAGYKNSKAVKIPIAHHDGNYFAKKDEIKALEDNGQIAFRYSDKKGRVSAEKNPNGSVKNIAGIFNKGKNILGMMPHPERLTEEILGGEDGRIMFDSLVENFN